MGRGRSLQIASLGLAASLVIGAGCKRDEDQGQGQAGSAPAKMAAKQPQDRAVDPLDPQTAAGLDGAVLEASYETDSLAELLAALPRPTPTESALVALVGGILDAIADDPADRLARIGLRSGARIYAAARPLDLRGPALRKRLSEELEDGSSPAGAPKSWRALTADAHTLGVHLRASLPASEGGRLLRTLRTISETPRASGPSAPGLWAETCAALDDPELCAGWPQLLVWARPLTPELVRVDAVYLFYPPETDAPMDEINAAVRSAEDWPAPLPERLAASRPPFHQRPMELRVYRQPMLALLEAEALADVVVDLSESSESSEPEREDRFERYLDRERALGEIVAGRGLFDGLRLDMSYVAATETLAVELSWLPIFGRRQALAQMFAPATVDLALPTRAASCARALSCARIAGLDSVLRFTELAHGAYADLTGVSRIMRQAGERGSILLGVSAWPRLLGTAGAQAELRGGLAGSTQAKLVDGSAGLGFVVHALEPSASASRGLAYLRLSEAALASLGSAATLVGLRLESVELGELESVERAERGRYDDFAVYFIDAPAPDPGAWVVVVDDCSGRCADAAEDRVRALLASAREAGEIDPVAYLELEALGPVAGYEEVAYGDDPPVRAWLDRRQLDIELEFGASGPTITATLAPRDE